jgi:DNA (cytosine-5)-methyltransferase 1
MDTPRKNGVAAKVIDAGKKSGHIVRYASQPVMRPIDIVKHALKYRSQDDLASLLGVTERTIRRWVVGEQVPRSAFLTAISHDLARDERPRQPDFTFVDLFAGIGGLRRGFQPLNGKCVFTCEWDQHACRTYKANFPDGEDIAGDITGVLPASVPNHDILLAGFPCQPFSLAGVTKKNSLGRAHGFKDKAQGTLFFNILKILEGKEPKAFLLENVKNLRSHDGGRTYAVIVGALKELGYTLFDKVIDAQSWVPQHRERIFLVGFKKPVSFSFDNIERPLERPTLKAILHSDDEAPEERYTLRRAGRTIVDPRYTISDRLWEYLKEYAAKHRSKGNGFGYSVFSDTGIARTLSARYHKDGSEILIAQKGKNPRRLTPRECARLMGFDASRKPLHLIPGSVSDTQAYRQFGNAVVVPVVEALARLIVPRVLHPEAFAPVPVEQLELLPS